MKRVYLSFSLITLLLACLFIVPAYAQNGTSTPNWNFNCTDGQYVEVIGSGTQVPNSPPTILQIPDFASIDSIVTEVVFKGAQANLPVSATIMSDVAQTITNSNQIILPNFGSTQTAGVFRTTMNPANQLMASVSPASAGSYTWAFIAYVYRSGSGKSSSGVYSSAVVLNNSYSITLPIAVTAGPKNLTVKSILSELNADTNRIVLVNVTAGGVTVLDSVEFPNLGTSLNLTAYTLFNVPGSTTSLTLTYDSPIILPGGITGDSFIPGANVTVESCPCNITVNVDSTSNALCKNSTDGSISISVTGGTPPLTYAWSNSASTEDLTNIGAGVYSVTVFDATQCSASATSIVITDPSAVNASITNSTNVTINGAANGTATASGSGGTSPYTYLWSNTQTTAVATNLSAGPYTVTVSDVNGCSDMDNIEISQPDSLTITTSHTNVICGGDSTGTATVDTVIGGVSPYTYLWSNNETTQTITGLPIGTYLVTVTDANGAIKIGFEQVTGPQNPLSASSVDVDENCFNGLNGMIDLTPTGGTPTYTYLWSNNATTQDLIAVGGGTYTVTITDANNCTYIHSTILTEPDSFYVTETHVNILCNGDTTGSIDVEVFGGTNPYSYFWSNGKTTQDLNDLGAGVYTVFVTDASLSTGCTAQIPVTISEPTPVVVTAQSTDVDCFGDSTGTASASASGGTGSYTYLWSTNETTSSITGLAAGTYIVTATDSLGCTDMDTVVVMQPQSAVAVNITTSTNVSVNAGSDGTATATASGGTPALMLVWSNGDTGNFADSLSAGTYIVTVTDANGCTDMDTVVITEPDTISITTISTDVLCHNDSNGTVSVTNVIGGISPYSYLWNTGDTTATVTGLPIGTYTVTVTDANGASATGVETIQQPNPIVITIDSLTHLTCNGANDGSFVVNVSGGPSNGAGPYDILVGSSPGSGSSISSNLPAGVYYVTVTDRSNAASCTASTTVTITEPDSLTCGLDLPLFTCFGIQTTATVTANGGTQPYTYLWSDGSTSTSLDTIFNPGNYTLSVTVTDANQCQTNCSDAGEAAQPIIPNITVTNPNCFGDSTGSIAINSTSGGTAVFNSTGYLYYWSTNAPTSATVISGLKANKEYSLTIRDEAGADGNLCESDSFKVTLSEPPVLSCSILRTHITCYGGADGSISVTASGGTSPYAYLWNDNDTNAVRTNLSLGTYIVTITDANGCSIVKSRKVIQPKRLRASKVVTKVSCFGGNDGAIDLTAIGGTSPYTFQWDDGSTDEDRTGLAKGTYTVTITDANNCTKVLTPRVKSFKQIASTRVITDATCAGNDGAIDLTVTRGKAPYTYLWSNADTTQDLSGIPGGTYVVTVTDANNCTYTRSIDVGTIASLTCSVSISNHVSCFGDNDGLALAIVNGGTPPYSFVWSNGQTTTTASGLIAGIYTVTVTDASGNTSCTTTCQDTIIEPPLLECTITNVDSVSCNGYSDGSMTVTASGGTPPYTYSWNTTPVQTTATANGLSAGTYTVTVMDASGNSSCMTTCTDSVPEPPLLECTITNVDSVSCNGYSDGSMTVTASGGTPPYTYAWNTTPVQTTATANGLSAGTYTVTVMDASGNSSCMTTCTDSVPEPPLLECTITNVDSVSCNGYSDGSMTVTASGGTPPYTYAWNTTPVQTTAMASGLSAGTYTVTVMDASGNSSCMTTCTDSVPEPPLLECTITNVDSVSCNGYSDGSMTVTASGGTPPYTYAWNTTPVQTTAMASGLSAGTYTVTVMDASGNSSCMTTCTDSVPEPPLLECTITNVDSVSCNGYSDGSMTVTASGGTPPYTYAWNTTPVQTTAMASGLSAGTYTVTVMDASGNSSCMTTCTDSVPEPPLLECTITNVDSVSCNGYSDGSMTVTASGGTPPYTYAWNTTPVQTTATANGLSAGTYTVTVMDASGNSSCMTTCTDSVPEPPLLECTITNVDSVSCNGYSDGSMTVTASGGTPPYTYAWNTTPVQTTATANGLSAGTYTVTVMDASGNSSCMTTCTDSVPEPPLLECTITNVDSVSCNGYSDGSMTVTASGGTPPYTYSWNTTPVQTTAMASGLSAGTYTVTVMDASGNSSCMTTCTDSVPEPPLLECTITNVDSVSCNGYSDGSMTVTASGGTPPYTYAWNTTPVQTTATASGLSAGTYTVTVMDASGNSSCMTTCTDSVPEPPLLECTITNVDSVSCNGYSDGSMTVTASGGTPPYTYAWNTTPVQTTAMASGLSAGTYTVTVMDASGNSSCMTTCTDSVPEPPLLECTITNVDSVSCNGYSDGSMTVTASGGTPPYTYAWNTTPVQTTAMASGLSAGTYTVTVMDASGNSSCMTTCTDSVPEPPLLECTITNVDSVSCNGYSDGSMTVTASGGTPPYTYAWNTTPVQTTATANGLSAGTYTVTVMDASGNSSCMTTCTDSVPEPPLLECTITNVDSVSCNGYSDGSMTVTASGGTPPYTYAWNTTPVQTTATASGLSAGTYTVTVMDASGNSSCMTTCTDSVPEPPLLECTITNVDSVSCNGYSDGSMTVTASGGTPPYTYAWNTTPVQTTATANGLSAGTYTVTVMDASGNSSCMTTCTDSVPEPPLLECTITNVDSVSCNGYSDGSMTVTASGGTPPYTYAWNTTPVQTTATANGLSAGTYTVTVMDASGNSSCMTTCTDSVPEPPLLECTITNVDSVSCNGYSDGSMTVTASGGTPPYTYSWNTTPVQTTAMASGLSAGTYTVTVMDASGNSSCMTTCTDSVPEPLLLECNIIKTDATCITGKGSATVFAIGGTAPFSYEWSSGDTTQMASGLPVGTYTATITDANNCTTTCSTTIIITDSIEISCTFTNLSNCTPPPPPPPPVVTPCTTCDCDGKIIQMTVIYDGPAGASVNVGPSSSSNPTSWTNVQPGDTLTANLGDIGNDWYWNVNGSNDANIHASCSDDILNNVNSSKSDFGHLGSYPNPDQNSTDGTFLVIGHIDDKGNVCGDPGNAIPAPCPCVCDGKIIEMTVIYDGPAGANVNVGPNSSSNPTSWTNVQPGDTLIASLGNIGNDWYWIVNGVQDANIHASCSDDILNNVNSTKSDFGHLGSYPNPDQNSTDGTFLVIGHVDDKANVCGNNGSFTPPPLPCICDGKIVEMTVIYDGPAGASVNVGSNSSSNPTSWTNVQPGDTLIANLGNIGNDWYWIVNGVQDANIHASCSDDILNNVNSTKSDFGHLGSYPNPDQNSTDGTFLVIGHKDDKGNVCQNPTPIIPPPPPPPTPSCDGTISCTVTGGSGQYSYTWTSTNSTTSVSSINAPNLDSLCAGVYCVVVTDLVSGCMDSVCITIDTADVLTCVASGDTVQCGASTGTVSVSPNGGVMPYTYLWNTGDSTAVVNNLGPGVYEVLVTDAKGCTTVCQATIVDIAPIVTICPDQAVGYMPPSCDCDGKIVEMVVIYDGPAGASVNVGPSSSSNTTSWSNVQPGDTLIANLGNIGNDWYWIVNGVQDANIHASCSDDILNNVNSTKSDYGSLGNYPNPHMNNNNGTFLVIGHTDDKGNVCPAGGVGGILGGATANINIDNVSGGTAPYAYIWSTGETTEDIVVNISANTTYTVTVTDANGCTATAVHTVTVVDITVPGSPDKVIMCHDPYTNPHTHDIAKKDIAKKLSEGWTLGPCGYDFSQPNACGSYMQFCGCEGGIQAMGVIYNGAAGATVAFYDGSVSASNLVQSYTNVMPGDSLFFTGNGNKFSSGSNFTINGGAAIEIHLSCSQPVQWETFGGVLYVYGTQDDNGTCCNLDCPPPVPVCACDGKIVEMTVIYDGPSGASVNVGASSSSNTTSWSNVQTGDTLIANLGNIGNDWYWNVNGSNDGNIHASCSDDILGNVNSSKSDFGHLGSYPNPEQNSNDGTFLVIGHVDENGNICTIGQAVPRGFSATSISQHLLQLNVYPNPTTGQLNVSFVADNRDNYKLELMDMTGRVVFVEADATHSGVNFLTYDFNSLPKGVYILQLNMNSQVERLRVIID